MNICDAFKLCYQGQHIRRDDWADHQYLLNDKGNIKFSTGENYQPWASDITYDGWEVISNRMTFMEALKELKLGYQIRRLIWSKSTYLGEGFRQQLPATLTLEDIEAKDWISSRY
jgi:hypothetical protein